MDYQLSHISYIELFINHDKILNKYKKKTKKVINI